MVALDGRATIKEIGLAYTERNANNIDNGTLEGTFNGTGVTMDNPILEKVAQLRYLHIAFGCMSIVLAFWVVCRIWYDSWRASKLQVKLRPRKLAFLYDLHPAESFPLVLGILILIQQLSFVLIQSSSLDTLFISGCRTTSQVVFTLIFVTGIFHYVFGFELTLRSLGSTRFATKRRHTTTVCVIISVLLTITVWLVTRLRPPANECFGDMIWRSLRNSRLGIALCAILIPSFLVMAAIIGTQLRCTARVEQNERIAGTRMVYYLLLSAAIYTLILPFWVQATIGVFDDSLTSSRIAEFVLFISGAAIAFLHLFLRANAVRTAIKPSTAVWHERRRFRLCGPSDLELMHISAPIMRDGYEPNETVAEIWARQQAEKEQVGLEMTLPEDVAKASPVKQFPWPLPGQSITPMKDTFWSPASTSAAGSSSSPGHTRNQPSYSLFPGPDGLQLLATVYSPNSQDRSPSLIGPQLVSSAMANMLTSPSVTDIREVTQHKPQNHRPPGHRRGSSTDSSETVQIGIRFSSAPAALAATAFRSTMPQAPRSPFSQGVDNTVISLHSRDDPDSNGSRSSRLDSPFDPDWSFLPPPSSKASRNRRTRGASAESEFAWLEAMDPRSSPIHSQFSQPQPWSAEENRYAMNGLGKSTSTRSRQGYKPPTTPDRAANNGFF